MTRSALFAGAALAAAALSACAGNAAPDSSVQSAIAPAEVASPVQNADVAELQNLTRILIDASALYDEAAKDVSVPAYAQQLTTLADARRNMANVFQQRLVSLGAAAPEHGQPLGTAHRAFMEARTLGSEDTKVAVQEALRGENYLLGELNDATHNSDVTPATRAFITAQITTVTAGRDRLEAYAHTLELTSGS